MIKVLRSLVVGPLEPYAAGFAAELERQGYTTWVAEKQVSLAAHLSRWMATSGAGPGDLTSDAAERQPPMTWAPAADLSISQMMPQRSTLVQTSRSGED